MYPETLCGRVWCLTKWPISTRLVAVYPLHATETAFIQLGLQSTAVGPHYMRLPGTTVFGLS